MGKIKNVSVEYICLAGNHSTHAMKTLLAARRAPQAEPTARRSHDWIPDSDLIYRRAWVLQNHELTAPLRFVLQGERSSTLCH